MTDKTELLSAVDRRLDSDSSMIEADIKFFKERIPLLFERISVVHEGQTKAEQALNRAQQITDFLKETLATLETECKIIREDFTARKFIEDFA